MDTVSMLNKMRFYCQPILPLVYDESMSYYETLCKVVGQLNTTGETVNKLNEGLTGEIADRQAADAKLDERLKVIEDTNVKTHFLVFDGANPNGGFPTRHELYQWVEAGDAIFTLLRTYEEGRGQIYAASCSYNAGNWGSEASNDFSIIVPIETSYDSTRDYAVKQKVAKLTIPPIPQTNLNAPWGLQIIEVNTPYTSAEGVVNLVAVINESDSVNCSITPSEFLGLYNTTRGGKNLCVAVNAKLAYDGLARSSSVATVDTTNRKIRIAFERDYGVFTENGVKQLNKTLDYIIGDASTNVWTHETIDSKTLDFSRYEGFQFTRGAGNAITANDESTPNAVYAQYHSDTSGKIYQNLPVRLIDTVNNAEYWNGVFDIKDDKHMTFTFVTSNYDAASGKMAVRVIELSADVNTTTWKYAEKEFTLPLSGGSAPSYVDFWGTGQSEVYDNGLKAWTVSLGTDKTFDYIFDLISSGTNVVARLYRDSTKAELVSKSMEANISGDKTLGFINFLFMRAADDVAFGFPTIADAIWVTKTSAGTSAYALYKWCALPVPAGDGADNGKVPTVNANKWELKTPTGGGSTNAVLYTPQTLTDEQKKQARENIGDVQPDWNQNDETQPDFVKNRPFYTGDPVETFIIPETTVTFSKQHEFMTAYWPENFDLVDGQTYTISWDGTDYVCTGVLFNDIPALGNLAVIGEGEDTGEPFVFANNGQWLVATTESATEHAIGIKTATVQVVTIDEKYLPRSVFTDADWDSVSNRPIFTKPLNANITAENITETIIVGGNYVDLGVTAPDFNKGLYYKAEGKISFLNNTSKQEYTLRINGYYKADSNAMISLGTVYDGYGKHNLDVGFYGKNNRYHAGNLSVTSSGNQYSYTITANFTIISEVKQLSEDYIPNTIQRVGDDIIISSSTPDSTKKFKITVDDSGTISAAEVT